MFPKEIATVKNTTVVFILLCFHMLSSLSQVSKLKTYRNIKVQWAICVID